MAKELSDMTLEELWELFPIVLEEYNPEYPKWYSDIERELMKVIDRTDIYRMTHIGSTAVEGLLSKPTIDILLEVQETCDLDAMVKAVVDSGWGLMSSNDEPIVRRDLNKGYTKFGFADKVFHLHIRYPSDSDELYFRDYLKNHPDVVEEYRMLKLELIEDYRNDRDTYTSAKSEFVKKYSKFGKMKFPGRYSL
jgi:GrpB-like predicted nucleotidyltransferase (UPF0157 family)